MTGFINKFKIPTFLGLSIILVGIASGIYLTLREQTLISKAAPNLTPQKIVLTNLTADLATISWQTNSPSVSFVTFGQNNPGEQTVLDDKDTAGPKPHVIHYVTLKNLLPKTKYQFKIVSGKITSDVQKFETLEPLANQTDFSPIIGSVLNNNIPVDNGVVYLSLPDAIIQSSSIKPGGNFLIPLSQIGKADLSGGFSPTEDTIAKLTIYSDLGEASVLFKLKSGLTPLPPIKLGQNIDLTTLESTPKPSPTTKDLDKYDLNGDGKINSADNAVILQYLGKNSKSGQNSATYKKADLNGDGKVDQKDLDLMAQRLKELGSQ
ncbi:dockerin type I domain-containing protein [Patescibacteria group bacterium]|nr:dockerin type I domain-containing protein [Patescibacteria group bacterium]